jgi:hypothetical protein
VRPWIVPALAALILMATCVMARSDEPMLPAGIACADVRAKVAEHGKFIAYAWARLHGYSRHQISEAKKCLTK